MTSQKSQFIIFQVLKNIKKGYIVVENRPTQDHFSKVSIYNFSGLKKYKKGYIEMTEIYLETFEKCPASVYFPLL